MSIKSKEHQAKRFLTKIKGMLEELERSHNHRQKLLKNLGRSHDNNNLKQLKDETQKIHDFLNKHIKYIHKRLNIGVFIPADMLRDLRGHSEFAEHYNNLVNKNKEITRHIDMDSRRYVHDLYMFLESINKYINSQLQVLNESEDISKILEEISLPFRRENVKMEEFFNLKRPLKLMSHKKIGKNVLGVLFYVVIIIIVILLLALTKKLFF